DVDQVATFYAVHMLLSDWDGFFNNHYLYHDLRKDGKWTMYPWDQDKTWGLHDGLGPYDIFFDMSLTTGMTGDRPPGYPKDRPVPQGCNFTSGWWRPARHFSEPLLANPQFRQRFLARIKELLEKVYTEEMLLPLIQTYQERLEAEVKERAKIMHQDQNQAAE